MTATTFQERLARIESRRPPIPEFTPVRFAGSRRAALGRGLRGRRRTGRNLAWMGVGAVAGLLMAVLLHGATLPGSPWGPGSGHDEIVGLVGLGGVLAALPTVLLSVYMRVAKPAFFFFSVAYAVAVIGAVLV
ncbi:hypothetical protein QO034_05330 [Sedimentitalea sp. JM2-8]|uniref:Uncharacterized protein n=1 Tax=Sedimentitalea xiamensis TaxID=3050037 RepID=A0ABT7FBX4_9RHOB|nr:hypothetical protein [Sedimentitalea xiamensis]MDK3072528.1 hypothetical protein [Sedimentitalea xiamensis]